MSDHPSTFKGNPANTGAIAWDDRAELHRADDGDGLFDGAKTLKSGSFAEIIRHLMLLPENERSKYVIEKAGDREYTASEAADLYARQDFPADDV